MSDNNCPFCKQELPEDKREKMRKFIREELPKLKLKKERLERSKKAHCPYCNGTKIHTFEQISITASGREAWQDFDCLECKKKWRDVWTLTDVQEIHSLEELKKK
jgi:hypothetical protein